MEEVGPGNVIYVAFGSQSYMTDVQMEEIALGLEKAGQPFIWVVSQVHGSHQLDGRKGSGKEGLVVRD